MLILRAHWHDRVSGERYRPGDKFRGDKNLADWLIRSGIAVDADNTPKATPVTPPPKPATEAEPADKPAPKRPKRPNRAAKLAVWQDYARTQGIDPKGYKREELIALFQ